MAPETSDPIKASETTSTSWMVLGTIGAGGRAQIDRQAVLRPEGGEWNLDWWVRAEDRWHQASNGALVRQSLTDSTPVVLSGLRVPGGEIEQRAWCAVDGASGAPLLVAEYHNATAVPVALAIVVCAKSQNASTHTSRIEFDSGVVKANGTEIVRFSREPSRYGFDLDGKSAEELTLAGDAVSVFPSEGVLSKGSEAKVVFVFPLPHTATLRVVAALDRERDSAEFRRADLSSFDFGSLAPFDRVVSGWKTQLSRSPRIDLPERSIEDAIDAARAHLLVHVANEDPLRWPGIHVSGVERSELAMALDEQGLSSEAERLLVSATDLQNADGSFDSTRLDATASWVVAAERHCALCGNDDFARACAERVASAAHWLAKRQRGNRLRPSSRFFANGGGPEGLVGAERVAYDARWTTRAYSGAISLLKRAGQLNAANAVQHHLDELNAEMGRLGISQLGSGSGLRRIDAIAHLRSELLEGEPLWAWGDGDDAHDPARTAGFLRGIRSILAEDQEENVDLLPGFAEDWLGQPVAVLRLLTNAGSVSFALRWHGARPALLWEVEGARDFRLTCGAIDPEWSTTERRGEVLLSAPILDHVHVHEDDAFVEEVVLPEKEPKPMAQPPQDGGGSFT